jgi:tetratricopeptide (TPR) repeat protein
MLQANESRAPGSLRRDNVKNRMKLGAGIGFLSSFGFLAIAAPTVLAITLPSTLVAQAGATITGVAKDPAGQPYNSGEVRFSTDKTTPADKRKYQYTIPVGADGTYKATDVAPGSYIIAYFRDGKSIWYHELDIKSGETKTVDFDLSSDEYLKGLSPEDRAKLEEAKKKNATAIAENAKIADVNKTLLAGRADEKTDPDKAVSELTPLTTQRPNEPIIWAALGEAQLAAADKARSAAMAAKTPVTDPAILQKYADAAASYQKALDTNAASKKPDPGLAFTSYLNLGQALGRSGKTDEASAAYENAAKADPTKAGMAFYNEAAIDFNSNKLKEANEAADKAIAADPKRADAYYIKASALIPGATVDPATKKFILPPGCLEAYQEYLELAPTGNHAQDVKELLANLGQPQKNSFKAKK